MRIAIASGKGGTGKTFISTNLFRVAQNEGVNVCLVDCDAEEPNGSEFIDGHVLNNKTITQNLPVIDQEKCTFCGKCFEYCNYNAIVFLPDSNYIQVIESLCHDCGACSVACADGAISEIKKNIGVVRHIYVNSNAELYEANADIGVYSPVKIIKTAISEAYNYSLCILDSPPGISCPFIATVEKADYIVLVTEPTPFGLNDLKLTIETLNVLGKQYGVIINKSDLGDNELVKWAHENKVEILLKIPYNKEIAAIYSKGELLVEKNHSYYSTFKKLLNTLQTKAKND
jgi:MinD superfamily P-loop ATPase